MDDRSADRGCLDRIWQALADWRRGELQQQVRDKCLSLKLFRARRHRGRDPDLAAALQ